MRRTGWPYLAVLLLGLYCDRPMVAVAPPEITVLEPDPNTVIRTAEVDLRVRATSFRPISGLWANGLPLAYRESDRSWHLRLALRPGINRIVLEAADLEGVRGRDTLYLLRLSLRIRRGADMRQARAFHTATPLADGTILLVGGLSHPDGEAMAEVERYDPRTGRSYPTAGGLIRARAGHVALPLSDGRVLFFGGARRYPPRTAADFVREAELYDPATDRFHLLPLAGYPVDRAFFDAVWYPHPNGPYIWMLGGWGDLAPASPDFVLGIRQDGRFYLFRNDSLSLYGSSGAPLYLEPAFGHLLLPLGARTYALLNTAFYSAGSTSQNQLLELDRPRARALRPFHQARTGHAAAELQPGIWLVLGGAVLTGSMPGSFVPSIECFIPALERFYLYPEPLFLARAGLRATKTPDDRIMLSGGWSAQGISRAVEWIELER